MTLSTATLEADGFVRNAREGLFYELRPDGALRRFGLLRPGPEPGEDAGWTVEIAADGQSALNRNWSQGIHPHPDGDPAFSVAMWADAQRQLLKDRANGVLRCGFCEKTQAEVRKLIAGPSLYICDECATLCAEIAAS